MNSQESIKGIVVETTGKIYAYEFSKPIYLETKKILDGSMELIPPLYGRKMGILNDNYIFVGNNTGKIQDLPINPLATALFAFPQDYVVGNVILFAIGRSDFASIPDNEITRIIDTFNAIAVTVIEIDG